MPEISLVNADAPADKIVDAPSFFILSSPENGSITDNTGKSISHEAFQALARRQAIVFILDYRTLLTKYSGIHSSAKSILEGLCNSSSTPLHTVKIVNLAGWNSHLYKHLAASHAKNVSVKHLVLEGFVSIKCFESVGDAFNQFEHLTFPELATLKRASTAAAGWSGATPAFEGWGKDEHSIPYYERFFQGLFKNNTVLKILTLMGRCDSVMMKPLSDAAALNRDVVVDLERAVNANGLGVSLVTGPAILHSLPRLEHSRKAVVDTNAEESKNEKQKEEAKTDVVEKKSTKI